MHKPRSSSLKTFLNLIGLVLSTVFALCNALISLIAISIFIGGAIGFALAILLALGIIATNCIIVYVAYYRNENGFQSNKLEDSMSSTFFIVAASILNVLGGVANYIGTYLGVVGIALLLTTPLPYTMVMGFAIWMGVVAAASFCLFANNYIQIFWDQLRAVKTNTIEDNIEPMESILKNVNRDEINLDLDDNFKFNILYPSRKVIPSEIPLNTNEEGAKLRHSYNRSFTL